VRWFLAENTGDATLRVTLSLKIAAAGEWRRHSRHAFQLGDRLAVVSEASFSAKDDTLTLPLGRIGVGKQAAAALFVIVAKDQASLDRSIARADEARRDPLARLEQTKANWQKWCAETPLETGDERTDDLLDSLLCLVRAHLGPEAIHTGSVRYPHDRAWVRDDYWVQRALLELGRAPEARLNLDFFHRAWQKSGIASSYQIPDGKPMSWGYTRVELPHYLVLMVRDAEELGRVDAGPYWDMVRGCLDNAAVSPEGLQPMNGDETWILAAPVRELDDLLDNSLLLIASAEYGSKLALRMHDPARAANYGALAYRARMALRKFMPDRGQQDWFALGRGGDGSLDFSLCPEVYARAAILHVLPATDGLVTSGLIAGWQRLNFDRGIRTHARSATSNGGTPGYVLYAAADSPSAASLFSRELLNRMPDFASATGCVWELHDLHDPAWGGEKRRLWDSAVLLLGMAHALFDIQRLDRVHFVPRREPTPIIQALTDLPDFNAEELLSAAGPALIFEQQSPEHAARIARELLRHCNRQFAVAPYTDAPPEDQSAIIVSVGDPPGVWLSTPLGYYVRAWGGPPQLWVKNRGNVYADTDPVLTDLLSYLPPQRERPSAFPDANFELASRFGEAPSGVARITALSNGHSSERTLDLAGEQADLTLGDTQIKVQTYVEKPGTMTLAVTATRPAAAELSLTLPSGWWLLYARDMTGKWDRVADPVREERLPDGRVRLNYSLRASKETFSVGFQLARLGVGS